MYSERLKELRKNKKLTQKEVAEKIGVARTTYAMYEQNRREPDNETLQKIADFFNVTTDYLLGRTDDPTMTAKEEAYKKVTVNGSEIELSAEEYKVFQELKKYPVLFHDLASNPETKVKQLIKMWEVLKLQLDEINESEE